MALSTAIGTLIFPKVQKTAIGNLLTTSANIKQPSNDNGISPLKERQDSYDHQKENGKKKIFEELRALKECNLCGANFASKEAVELHIKINHKEEKTSKNDDNLVEKIAG